MGRRIVGFGLGAASLMAELVAASCGSAAPSVLPSRPGGSQLDAVV